MQTAHRFLFILLAMLLSSPCAFLTDVHSESYQIVVESKAPTCVEDGYRLLDENGTLRMEDLPAKGHQFSLWTPDPEGTHKTHTCQICGYEEVIRISSIPEDSIPRLDLTGDISGIGKKNRVVVSVDFKSPEQSFQCLGLLTLQGHSTYGLPKKNYTIRFYNDASGTKKHRLQFKNWNAEHKYILKANYADLSQCRNLAGARIWEDMAADRPHLSDRLSRLPTLGTVDGFPVAVYLNDRFFGLYTLNLHKDDDLYQMKKGRQEALLICNQQTEEESLFRSPAAFSEDSGSDWEIEFCGSENQAWAKDRFNQLISFVMESTDSEFKAHLDDYLDVDGAVDYLLFIYALGLEHSGAKDLVMLSYGGPWIPSAFDMDEAFGLDPDHGGYRTPDVFLPSVSAGTFTSGTGSLLWDRLLENFWDQLVARYQELRLSSLSNDHLLSRVHQYTDQIPESFYDMDYYLFPERPVPDLNMKDQIESYIPQRMNELDRIFTGGAS